ncbi:EAL domain-containing protein [Xanthobacter dioxanivorans]|uniref:EAL domain-containing protein n=1 Tax=Xanthobacter dioxanivorans TaxID=2528964 RepID=A0A974PN69_9HYPH|nr:EAL domain-containing protein [Xanthobacter dioxanivorans]QRG06378.1 EAL domain-containing protein [Xanthobacter dioxanivorans]
MLHRQLTSADRSRGRLFYFIIFLVSVCIWIILVSIDFSERIFSLNRTYESLHLDEIYSGFVVATFALIAILVVHERRLRAEIAERRYAEKAARDAAHFDALTGIANRALFQQEFGQALKRAEQSQTRLALLVIDIDQFSTVNDMWGYSAGDEILYLAATRLRTCLQGEDFVARLGSDEFSMLFPMLSEEPDKLFRLATRVLNILHEPFVYQDKQVKITASIGISKFPRDGVTETVLLQCAETAMWQAKAAGKDRYALYDPTLDERRRARLAMEADLHDGFERGEIIAHYQPLVDLASRRIMGFEALARWNHPTRGLLGAPAFIPIAEDAGLVDTLFTAMLRRVCEDTREWPAEFTVAINLSPMQLLDPQLPRRILDLLSAMQVPPQRIELEITETALVQDFEAARRSMSALRAEGVCMSLDDFGTGFSSLRHLYELPIDKIKIDRSFTAHIVDDPQCRKIVASMLGLGRSLELVTVAEGVETPEEADWLRGQGCSLGQGYLFARPMSAADAGALAHAEVRRSLAQRQA